MIRRDYIFGGQSTFWYSTEYDLLGRPTNATDSVSLVREWLYNRRSELAAANIGTNCYGYAYDTIGNRLWSAENAATNSYTANSLNQYVSVLRASQMLAHPSGSATPNLPSEAELLRCISSLREPTYDAEEMWYNMPRPAVCARSASCRRVHLDFADGCRIAKLQAKGEWGCVGWVFGAGQRVAVRACGVLCACHRVADNAPTSLTLAHRCVSHRSGRRIALWPRSSAPLHLRAVGTCPFSRSASVTACTAYMCNVRLSGIGTIPAFT